MLEPYKRASADAPRLSLYTRRVSLRSTFVLIHGAWQGASTWDLIVPKLQTAGHKVFAPVLTGLGEDSHRLSPAVDLGSHIDDVAGILERENLHGVTLVGHSYAGMVITGVAERESGRLSRLIYVDAFVPDSGQGRAVSIGIITSCPPAIIAIWKPLRDLVLPC